MIFKDQTTVSTTLLFIAFQFAYFFLTVNCWNFFFFFHFRIYFFGFHFIFLFIWGLTVLNQIFDNGLNRSKFSHHFLMMTSALIWSFRLNKNWHSFKLKVFFLTFGVDFKYFLKVLLEESDIEEIFLECPSGDFVILIEFLFWFWLLKVCWGNWGHDNLWIWMVLVENLSFFDKLGHTLFCYYYWL